MKYVFLWCVMLSFSLHGMNVSEYQTFAFPVLETMFNDRQSDMKQHELSGETLAPYGKKNTLHHIEKNKNNKYVPYTNNFFVSRIPKKKRVRSKNNIFKNDMFRKFTVIRPDEELYKKRLKEHYAKGNKSHPDNQNVFVRCEFYEKALEDNGFTCGNCRVQKKSITLLKEHQFRHHKNDKIKCHYCRQIIV